MLPIAYAVLCLSFLINIWVIATARWLYKNHRWKNTAYFIANLSWALRYVGVGIALAIAITPAVQELASIPLFLSILLALGHLLLSLYRRLREGRRAAYRNRFWRLVNGDTWFWRMWTRWTQNRHSDTTFDKTVAAIPPRTHPRSAGNLPWHSITLPVDPAATETILIPPREQDSFPQSSKLPIATVQKTSEAEPGQAPSVDSTSPNQQQESFVIQARRLAARHEPEAIPVPFSHYSPTYEQMSADQQRWYFYWRSEVRAGNFLPTDLSYLFVYVYECINLVGFENPQAAFDKLVTFWHYYRVLQPKLDNYLIDWIADFTVIHQLPITQFDWYEQVAKLNADKIDVSLYVESWIHTGNNWEEFSSEALFQLAEFSPKRSKFRKMYEKQDLNAAYKKGLQAVDEFLMHSQRTSLFSLNTPSTTRLIQRIPFAGAHHDYDSKPITIAEIRPWLGQQKLRKQLKSIIKQTENILRDQQQFGTKLLGIDLPATWVEAIQQAFVVMPEKRTVTVDFAKVAELQRATEETRKRLTIPEEEYEQLVISLDRPVADRSSAAIPSPSLPEQPHPIHDVPYLQRPTNTPSHLLTDLVEISAIMGDAKSQEAALLIFFYEHKWEVPQPILSQRQTGQFFNVTVDHINERAIEQLGDALIFEDGNSWIVAEDYRDEISYILDHPAYQTLYRTQDDDQSDSGLSLPNGVAQPAVPHRAVPQPAPDVGAGLELPSEWMTLTETLQSEQKAVILSLLQKEDVSRHLDALARAQHTTANQLIDQVNEVSLEIIGDIIIATNDDVPTIEAEYVEPLAQTFGVRLKMN